MASLGPYRSVGTAGAYPDWLRALKAATGVYVLRDGRSKRVLYVGSSNGKLYATISRHLQIWRRAKGFWKGMRGTTDHDPGTSYDRGVVEVAYAITSRDAHLHEEARLIRKLKPRDNLVSAPDGEPVPF